MLLAETASEALPVGTILMGLFGGLALFLWGMDQMSESLKLVAGGGMKKLLGSLTTNRFTGALAGAVVTAVIQSSSVTTVLVVGFVSAGLMSLSQSIGVIMGANVGTTVTAQIIAFKVTHYGLVLVASGFLVQFCFRNEKLRYYGQMIMGLGLVFFGMQLMSDGTRPLRSYEPFIEMMGQMDNPFMAILMSAAFTALVQSSSATTGLVIVLAGQGFISLEAGIALIFGANVGTCVTAILASIGKSREAVRSALVHLIFNVGGVLLWYPFIGRLAEFTLTVSPVSADLEGTARLAAETPRQIANAHTLFNISNTLIFIWFTTPLAWLVTKILPQTDEDEADWSEPRYLNEYVMRTPSLALDFARLELNRLGKSVLRMVSGVLDTVVSGDSRSLAQLARMDDQVDTLHGALVTYLGRLSQENLTDKQSHQLQGYLAGANYLESIGDMVETNLVDVGRERARRKLDISQSTCDVLRALDEKVTWSVERSIEAIVSNDRDAAREVMEAKVEINRLARAAEEHLSQRLVADEPNRLVAFRLETEVMEYLRRMYYFSKRIAKVVREWNATPAEDAAEDAADDAADDAAEA